jgi:hypothetical protein
MGSPLPFEPNTRFALLHVMGPQSQRNAEEIIAYKAADAERVGFTFWAQHSYRAKPHQVAWLCRQGPTILYLLASPSRKKGYKWSGEKSKATHTEATHYSIRGDGSDWKPLKELGLGPVEDNPRTLLKGKSYALKLGKFELQKEPYPEIDLADWADVTDNFGRTDVIQRLSVAFKQGAHVTCSERFDMSAYPQMKSRKRLVIAAAPLLEPYAVWLKRDTTAST